MGMPANAIAEAVFARCLSALKEERVEASKLLKGPNPAYHGQPRRIDQCRPRCTVLLENLRLCPGLPTDGRGAEGIQVEVQFRRDRRRSSAAAASSAPASCRRSWTPTRAMPNLVNLLLDPYFNEQIQTVPVQLAKSRRRWRPPTAFPPRRSCRPCRTTMAIAAPRLPANLLAGPARLFRRAYL